MDSAKLNEWMQVVGIFAVVASLVFVGLQMQQDREIALSVATQARTETTLQSIAANAANPFYMSAIDKIANGDAELLLASEKQALFLLGTQVLFNFENVHYQYLNGFVPEERWVGTRQSLKGLLKRPFGPRSAYEGNPAAWRESFQEVVNVLINEIDSESKGDTN